MEIRFNHVDEKDVDLLLMDRFVSEPVLLDSIKRCVEEKQGISLHGYEIESIRHSAYVRNGESDLQIILCNGQKKHALLIEDKIDALAQFRQGERYRERGEEGVASGNWNTFSDIIVAPAGYLNGNTETYAVEIAYDDIREWLGEADYYADALLKSAVEKQKGQWFHNPSELMTAFYDRVLQAGEDMGLEAKIKHKIDQEKGKRTGWVQFTSPLQNESVKTEIEWKSDQGTLSLCFKNGWDLHREELKMVIATMIGDLPEDYHWITPKSKTCKTAYLGFTGIPTIVEDEEYVEAIQDGALIRCALEKVRSLWDFAQRLNDLPWPT